MGVLETKLNNLQSMGFYTQKTDQDYSEKTDSLHLALVTPPSDEYRRKRIVTEDELMFMKQAVDDTGIKPYQWSLLKDNHTAIKKSQQHLIDLIRYYEGDSEHYYEAVSVAYKDKGGSKTIGFGEWLRNSNTGTTTQAKAYKKLSEHIQEHSKYVKNKVGQKAYDEMPQSIKEALIDLSFNKGPNKIGKIIKSAIADRDWAKVIANIHCVNMNGKDTEEPGLYRRSLSRAILAIRDLSGEEREKADLEIEKLYKKAVKSFDENNVDKEELNKIYEQYMTGKISGTPKSVESGKILVDESFAGKGLFAVAQKAYDSIADKQGVDFKTFYEEFKRINRNPDGIVLGSELNVPYINNITQGYVAKSDNIENVEDNKIETPENKNSNNFATKIKNVFAKAWDGIKNFFKSLGEFFKNLFGRGKEEEEKVDPFADYEFVSFQDMVEKGNITKQGMFHVISADYEIKKGNTLWSLAHKYDTTPEIICNNNNIEDKNLIKTGETIKIQKLGYKIEKGDNLYQISKRLGLSMDILKDMNYIECADKISEGQMLEIPGFIYKIKSGDTLSNIAERAQVSPEALMRINNLESDVIQPGQKILVVYDSPDHTLLEADKKVTTDKKSDTVTKSTNIANAKYIGNRPLILKPMKDNGKVVATRKVFEPTRQGKLSGKTIIVNAGHGYSASKFDIGAYGRNGIEDEWLLNYDNAMKLKDKLCAQGAKVIFLQGIKRLVRKEIKMNRNKADMFISVHVNSCTDPTKDRTQIYYREKDVSGAPKKNSIKLANIMEKNFDKWIPENENISKDDAFENDGKQDYAQSSVNDERTNLLNTPLNIQKIPGVIWEVAFISTPKGRERLKNPELISDYADVMTKSVIEYFG